MRGTRMGSGFYTTWWHVGALAGMAIAGHVLALAWVIKLKRNPHLHTHKVYDVAVHAGQFRRELKRSWIQLIHPVLLFLFCRFGLLRIDETIGSFALTLGLCFISAEIWHYVSHRAMHTKALLFIHRPHHEAHVCTPASALSFSLLEKVIFTGG